MSETAAEVAIIDLTNTTDHPLRVNVVIGGTPRHIVTLQPGQTTRQVTPSGAAWSFSTEASASTSGSARSQQAEANEDEVELDDNGGSKGTGGRMT